MNKKTEDARDAVVDAEQGMRDATSVLSNAVMTYARATKDDADERNGAARAEGRPSNPKVGVATTEPVQQTAGSAGSLDGTHGIDVKAAKDVGRDGAARSSRPRWDRGC